MAKPPKKARKRVDSLLVARGLAPDLAKAAAYVMAGQVVAGTASGGGERRVDKPSELLPEDAPLRVRGAEARVSRAGGKLAGAVEDLGLAARFEGAVVLDVGASTGGFTEASLELGARRVIAVDVGQNQLAWELRTDPRVTSIERTDVRSLSPEAVGPVDIVVADVSFNALARLVPHLVALGGVEGTLYLLLVKPQFELPRELVPEGGVVEDEALRTHACELVIEKLAAAGLTAWRRVDSRVPGRTGNREVFLAAEAPGVRGHAE